MNEYQKQFLNELDKLFLKYRVNQVKTGADGRTHFYGNGQCLSFAKYESASFINVSTEQDAYNPPVGRSEND